VCVLSVCALCACVCVYKEFFGGVQVGAERLA